MEHTQKHKNSSMGTSNHHKEEKQSKAFMIMMANTVVDPRAMVIHFHHASIDKKSRASGKSHYIIGQIS